MAIANATEEDNERIWSKSLTCRWIWISCLLFVIDVLIWFMAHALIRSLRGNERRPRMISFESNWNLKSCLWVSGVFKIKKRGHQITGISLIVEIAVTYNHCFKTPRKPFCDLCDKTFSELSLKSWILKRLNDFLQNFSSIKAWPGIH